MFQIEINNCTLASWPPAVALSRAELPALEVRYLIRSNLTSLPRATRCVDSPSGLKQVAIAGCNITSLPPDLNLRWRRLISFYLDDNQFT